MNSFFAIAKKYPIHSSFVSKDIVSYFWNSWATDRWKNVIQYKERVFTVDMNI